MKQFLIKKVSQLLHTANCNPGAVDQEGFYRLKRKLLLRWAEADGHDLQEIKTACNKCNATGTYNGPRYSYGKLVGFHKADCWECGGTGTYRHVKTFLNRWRIDEFLFHQPTRFLEAPQGELVGHIAGRVIHQRVPCRESAEAFFRLAFLFDWKLLWRNLGRICYRPEDRKSFFVVLSSWIFIVRWLPRKIQWQLRRKPQYKSTDPYDDELPF